jgi:hydroxylamine reductase
MSDMFCYQCQETARNTGCTRVGVCGKNAQVANLQDLLIYVTKGYSEVLMKLRAEGTQVDKEDNHRVSLNLFTTITNANFDPEAIRARINETIDAKKAAASRLKDRSGLSEAAIYTEKDPAAQDEKAKTVGVLATENEDIRSLRELITYGVKGLAAYTKHANALLQDNEEVDAFMQEAMAKTLDDRLSVDDLVQLTLDTGAHGVKGMATLDAANTGASGKLIITKKYSMIFRW